MNLHAIFSRTLAALTLTAGLAVISLPTAFAHGGADCCKPAAACCKTHEACCKAGADCCKKDAECCKPASCCEGHSHGE